MKILIVEDDPIVAESLNHLLASNDDAVDIASDAEVGLELVESYDLVAELTATNEQLRTALEELRLEHGALRQHNAELQVSREAFNSEQSGFQALDVKQQIAVPTPSHGRVFIVQVLL